MQTIYIYIYHHVVLFVFANKSGNITKWANLYRTKDKCHWDTLLCTILDRMSRDLWNMAPD